MKRNGPIKNFFPVFATTCLSLFAYFLFAFPAFAESSLPRYGRVPDFAFIERSGKEMKRSDFEGGVWIADFVFTRCHGMCPMLSGHMALLQEKLKDFNVKLVSFSVDPEHDTPEVLSTYASRYQAREGKWFFLTTRDKFQMWNFITEGFSLGVEEASPEDLKAGAEPVMHTNRFVLVDQKGLIRGYYDSSEPTHVEELVKDTLSLIPSKV